MHQGAARCACLQPQLNPQVETRGLPGADVIRSAPGRLQRRQQVVFKSAFLVCF